MDKKNEFVYLQPKDGYVDEVNEEVLEILLNFLKIATGDEATEEEVKLIPEIAKLLLDYSGYFEESALPVKLEIEMQGLRFLKEVLKEVEEAKKQYHDLVVQIKVLKV